MKKISPLPLNGSVLKETFMRIALAQTRFKTADFEFNYKSIVENIDKIDCDLIIFPEYDLTDTGAKDLVLDELCCKKQDELYEKIAEKNFSKAVLVGEVLIKDGEIMLSEDGFFDVCNKKIFVSDTYRDDVICDLFVLAKNRYYTMNSYKEFIESINSKNDFVYVNAVGMSDCNIYAGGSFAKNKENELVLQMPLCETEINLVDFGSISEFNEEPLEKQILEITSFALKEYCENTGFKRVILGLSGGIDSALTAAIAVKALGAENVFGVLMPSMFSSEGSVTDSLKLAENLGMRTEKHPITPLFKNFMDKIAHVSPEDENKTTLAEENLQARLRALILMYFSNRDNCLLLSTGNKSESAMGFGTLYGDLAGGLNLICDLTKTNVYKLSNYINKDGEIIPQEIIDKAPSAELHPGQKDQDRLPAYEILDDIIEMYLEQCRPVEEICEKYNRAIVDEVVKKIYRMQFKRKQGCLGVRLTERSFCCGVNLPVVQRFY